jgi:GTP pyrophosphokinase
MFSAEAGVQQGPQMIPVLDFFPSFQEIEVRLRVQETRFTRPWPSLSVPRTLVVVGGRTVCFSSKESSGHDIRQMTQIITLFHPYPGLERVLEASLRQPRQPLVSVIQHKARRRLVARTLERSTQQDIVFSALTSPVLTEADYSFYQRMKNDDVTEEFLWSVRLEPMLGYIPAKDLPMIREALTLAFDAHMGQSRKSGEPFITHPVEVTRILAELHMDTDSLVAGLLHDTVEDCGEMVGLEEIGFHFGQAVQRIVEGETKFSKLPTHHPERANCAGDSNGSENGASVAQDAKAQDLQFLFLAMTEEVRIIVVKLADRLHNMRTMASMPQSKQRRIALETLQVFSPLARLLGLYTIKEELEELSFSYAMPQQYAITKRAVNRLWETQRIAVEAASHELEDRIQNDPYLTGLLRGVKIEISRKALYSIWKKLQDSGRSIRDVSEIAQLRVILHPDESVMSGDAIGVAASERQLCYHTMGLVHSFWAPIPGSMKDYIATPKPNNYQSLHTTVIPTGLVIRSSTNRIGGYKAKNAPSLFPIEVQIKTEEMERLAQFGIAIDSWLCADEFSGSNSMVESKNIPNESYNGNGNSHLTIPQTKLDSYSMTRRINWLNSIRQWQEEFVDTLTAQEFVDCVTDDLLGQGVFVFTPSGQVMRLPKGASVVDFAYHIHTDVGNTMVAARVNGKIVPAEHRLANAEVVEVITYKGPTNTNIVKRHQQWVDAAQTKSARHKLLKFLKDNADLVKSHSFEYHEDGGNVGDLNGTPSSQSYWLKVHCIDRAGLLADISNAISRHNHNILSYSGYRDKELANRFTMEYELEGPMHLFPMLMETLKEVQSVQSWCAYCNLQSTVI